MKKQLLIVILSIFFSINAIAQLPKSAKDVKPIAIGKKIPNTKILTSTKGDVSTKHLFNKQQTILVIYRGGWCPFCSRQLQGIGEIKGDLLDMGYQIVAVSPDSRSSNDSERYSKNFIVGSDSSTQLIKKLGLAYQAPKKYSKVLRKASKGSNVDVIPAPAIFILNTEGKILFRHVSKDFKKRVSSELLYSIAEAYKE